MPPKKPYEIMMDLIDSLADYTFGDVRINRKNYRKAFMKIKEAIGNFDIDFISIFKTSKDDMFKHLTENDACMTL